LDGGENLYLYAPEPTGWVDPLGLARNVNVQKSTFKLPSIYRRAAGVEGKFSDCRYRYRLDTNKVASGEGGFHVHVYCDEEEVAKISGKGRWAKQHGGRKLLKPSQAPRDLRRDVNRLIRNAIKHLRD
jgi:uncharacterized protein RhaS with RHS repeats